MKPLIGEYSCKVDDKGRFLVPSGLRKQLPEDQRDDFVISRGLDNCLYMYPLEVWERELRRIQARNQYQKKNRDFTRMFLNGATPVALDGNGRALIPKRLAEQLNLGKDLVLLAQIDKIEIWDEATYQEWLSNPSFDFDSLAEEVMKDADESDD